MCPGWAEGPRWLCSARASVWPSFRGHVCPCTHAQGRPLQLELTSFPTHPPPPLAQLQTRKQGWGGLASTLLPQRGGQAKQVGGWARPASLGGARVGCGLRQCFLSGRWQRLWTEGWPHQGRHCWEKWGSRRLSQLPPEFMRTLCLFLLQEPPRPLLSLGWPQGQVSRAGASRLCPWARVQHLGVAGGARPSQRPQHLPAETAAWGPQQTCSPSSHCPKKWLETPRWAGLA